MAGMMKAGELDAALRACRVAHHIPGRLRVKLGGDTGRLPGKAEALALLDRLRSLEGVAAVQVNALARSCTVEYAPGVILPEAWDDLLSGRDTAAAGALLERFQRTGKDRV